MTCSSCRRCRLLRCRCRCRGARTRRAARACIHGGRCCCSIGQSGRSASGGPHAVLRPSNWSPAPAPPRVGQQPAGHPWQATTNKEQQPCRHGRGHRARAERVPAPNLRGCELYFTTAYRQGWDLGATWYAFDVGDNVPHQFLLCQYTPRCPPAGTLIPPLLVVVVIAIHHCRHSPCAHKVVVTARGVLQQMAHTCPALLPSTQQQDDGRAATHCASATAPCVQWCSARRPARRHYFVAGRMSRHASP
jgi:hypothetical protein